MSTKSDRVIEVVPGKEQLTSVRKNVTCTVEGCCKMFAHEGMLKMHLVKAHALIHTENDKRLFSKAKKKSTDFSYIFFCPETECKYSKAGTKHFTTFHLLKQHFMKMHAEKKFFCKKCEKGFSEQRFLRQHEDQCGNLYTCASCPVFYTTREALQTHCKRHQHIYPEEYRQRDKEKEGKQKTKKKSETPNGSMVSRPPVFPIVLLAVIKQDQVTSSTLPAILPKPSILVRSTINGTGKQGECETSTPQTGTHIQKEIPNRQEVMIQTDIYGVDSLSFNGRNQSTVSQCDEKQTVISGYNTFGTSPCDVLSKENTKLFASPSSPKGKTKAIKRRSSIPRPGSPRRKRSKTTTGIQTSVSLTQKKPTRIVSVSGTQTTGDLILKKAMAEADIPIQKRTVGSQITPQKQKRSISKANVGTDMFISKANVGTDTFIEVPHRMTNRPIPILKDSFSQVNEIVRKPLLNDSFCQVNGLTKPVLVDSFSQVQQRNIIAETLENMAESQTMTDLPESISTQTFHSYLVNMQDRGSASGSKMGHILPTYEDALSGNSVNDGQLSKGTNSKLDTVVSPETTTKGSIVQIYNDKLEKSLTIHVPIDEPTIHEQTLNQRKAYLNQIKLDRQPTIDIDSEKAEQISNGKTIELNFGAMNKNVTTSMNTVCNDTNGVNVLATKHSCSTETTFESGHIVTDRVPVSGLLNTDNVSVSDIEGSTMDTEVQTMSAQEFEQLLQSSGIYLEVTGPKEDWTATSNCAALSHGGGNNSIETNFNFFDANTDTIDMNTQTVSDLDLFDGIGAIDMNTQTTGNDLDFLDLVMNNMQTQTLNEEDLTSLGLSNPCGNPIDLYPSVHSLGVGTSDFPMISTGTSPRTVTDTGEDYAVLSGYETVTHSLGIGTSDFELDANFNSTNSMMSNSATVDGYSKPDDDFMAARNKTGLQVVQQTVQTETQTTGSENGDQLVQTEMQTQVDSNDIEFEVTNMQTQTTFEEFCDWLM